MPQLPPDLVNRADLNGSPGWAFGSRRFLLAASVYGRIAAMPWPRKSPTKQRVAKQPQVDAAQGSLFSAVADEEMAGLEALIEEAFTLDLETFVVAHSLDVITQDQELVLGRPRHNADGGQAWHWSQDLLRMPPASGGHREQTSPPPTDPDVEPDAPVRLRPPAARPGDPAVSDE
ncbi:MAG: hypothetical protein ACXVCF_04855 [Isosphaeraceae bacterium]